jgi:hypothetical protein
MNGPRAKHRTGERDDRWLEKYIDGARTDARVPRGFATNVMEAIYKESFALRSAPTRTSGAEQSRGHPHRAASRLMVSRMYSRLGISIMLTAAVLAMSLLVPHGAYPMLLGSGLEAALGAGPSDAVRNAMLGAGNAVQGMLGEQQIGGNQK